MCKIYEIGLKSILFFKFNVGLVYLISVIALRVGSLEAALYMYRVKDILVLTSISDFVSILII